MSERTFDNEGNTFTEADLANEDPNVLAKKAEQDLNTYTAKQGHNRPGRAGVGTGDSTQESGVNDDVERRFPGAQVKYGSEASGAGNNREIPNDEGGETNPYTGRQTKARDFEGPGGPEEKEYVAESERPGDQDVQGNVRQGTKFMEP